MKLKKLVWLLVISLILLPIGVYANNDEDPNNQESVNNETTGTGESSNGEESGNEDEDVVEITLDKNSLESDFATTFTRATRLARDDKENRLYKIIIPEGTYNVDGQLKVYKNVHIVLNNVTIVNTGIYNLIRLGDKSFLDTVNNGDGYGGYGEYSNITIEGGILDNNNLNQAIIRMGHASNITLKDITFKNVTNAHFVEFGAVKDVLVDGCTFIDFKGNFDSTTNYEALQIDALSHNHFGGFNPVNDETPSMNVTITNNTFKNLQRGVGTHTGIVNSYFNNFKINNNTFENITGYAIMATNYINSDISNNTMSNVGAGIMMRTMENAHKNFYASEINSNDRLKSYSLNNTITNNIINVSRGYKVDYSNVSYGIQLYGEYLSNSIGTAPKGDFRISGVSVNDNTINLNTLGYGIWVQGAIRNSLNRNKININIASKKASGGNGDGIRIVNGTNITIDSNIIRNNTTSGYDSKMNGITGNTSSKELKINNNKIYVSRNYGIYLDSTKNNIITNNYLYKNYKDGMYLYKTKGTTIQENKIDKTTRDGIRLNKSGSNVLKKNTITNANENAIDLLDGSSKNKVVGNIIDTIKCSGLYIVKSNEIVIDSNKITNIKKYNGIAISGSKKISIVKNTIKNCPKYGVIASKNQILKFSKNTIKGCKKGVKNW